MTKLLVCGARDWTDRQRIADVLASYCERGHVEVIHGDAPGADTLAREVAESYGFSVRGFPPDHARHGDQAGPMRNIAMVDDRPDKVIAFYDGDSQGTQHTIDEAAKRGIPVEIYSSQPKGALS
jgi:hypothetical protein